LTNWQWRKSARCWAWMNLAFLSFTQKQCCGCVQSSVKWTIKT